MTATTHTASTPSVSVSMGKDAFDWSDTIDASATAITADTEAGADGAPLIVCSVLAEELWGIGIPAARPPEIETVHPSARLLIALPDDEEGRREAALAVRLAREKRIEFRIDWQMHAAICRKLEIPWKGL